MVLMLGFKIVYTDSKGIFWVWQSLDSVIKEKNHNKTLAKGIIALQVTEHHHALKLDLKLKIPAFWKSTAHVTALLLHTV